MREVVPSAKNLRFGGGLCPGQVGLWRFRFLWRFRTVVSLVSVRCWFWSFRGHGGFVVSPHWFALGVGFVRVFVGGDFVSILFVQIVRVGEFPKFDHFTALGEIRKLKIFPKTLGFRKHFKLVHTAHTGFAKKTEIFKKI